MAPKRKEAPVAGAGPPAKKNASGAPKNAPAANNKKAANPGNKFNTPATAKAPSNNTKASVGGPSNSNQNQGDAKSSAGGNGNAKKSTISAAQGPANTKGAPAQAGQAGGDPGDPPDRSDDWVPWMVKQGDNSIDEYLAQRSQIPDSDDWFDEQKKLHQLLWMKGRHPLFPANWEYNFLMWGLPRKLYRAPGSQKGVAICNKGDEFRATKAIETLMDLTIKVADYDWIETPEKIRGLIVSTLRNYVDWATGDAGVTSKNTIPVVGVHPYSPKFKLPAGPNNAPAAQPNNGAGDADQSLDDIQKDIERKMQKLAKRHRDRLQNAAAPDGWTYMPPILFSYAVIHNVVLIVCLDSSDKDARVSVLEQLTLDSPSQWLWNALTLAIPINFARDHLYENRDLMADKTPDQLNSADPDA